MNPSQDKRALLIHTALRLFSAHGYRAVGIDRILAESGVAKMTLYKYFASKEALILAVLEARNQTFMESLAAHAASREEGLARLAAVFEWHAAWFASDDFRGCLFINASAEHDASAPEVTALAARHKQRIMQLLNEWLQPVVPPGAAAVLAVQFSMLIDGAIVAAHTLGMRDAAQQAWQAAQVLLNAAQAGVSA
jgi:AcrR family transcriptional regulator